MKPSKHRIQIDLIGNQGSQLHDLLSYYRLLRRESWTETVLKALILLAETENQLIADSIQAYLDTSPVQSKSGRPAGTPQPKSMRDEHSKRMKEYWANKKARLQTIEL